MASSIRWTPKASPTSFSHFEEIIGRKQYQIAVIKLQVCRIRLERRKIPNGSPCAFISVNRSAELE
jgi:hypothetical protein